MTYSYSKLSFDHFDYMGGATNFYPSPVRERKRKRDEKDPPNCIPAKIFAPCLEKQSKCKKVGKVLNHILSRRKVQTTFQGNFKLWLEEKVVIESHCHYSIINSACQKEIPQNLEDENPEEVHSESQVGKIIIANSSSDGKVAQKVDDSTHVFYLEHKYDEKEDCEVGEIVSKMTHQRTSRRNQLKKSLTGFCKAVKKAVTKQLHKISCFN